MSYAGKAGIAALLGGVGQAMDNFANMTAQEYQRRKQEEAAELRQIRMMNLREQIQEDKLAKTAENTRALLRLFNNSGLEPTQENVRLFSEQENLDATSEALLSKGLTNQQAGELNDRKVADAREADAISSLVASLSGTTDIDAVLQGVGESDLSDEGKVAAKSKLLQGIVQEMNAKSQMSAAELRKAQEAIYNSDWYPDAVTKVHEDNKAGNYSNAYAKFVATARENGAENGVAILGAFEKASRGIGAAPPGSDGRRFTEIFHNKEGNEVTNQLFWSSDATLGDVQKYIEDALKATSWTAQEKMEIYNTIHPVLTALGKIATDSTDGSAWKQKAGEKSTVKLLTLLDELISTGELSKLREIRDLLANPDGQEERDDDDAYGADNPFLGGGS